MMAGQNRKRRIKALAAALVALIALAAIANGLWRLTAATAGLTITDGEIGGVPVTLYRPASVEPAPVVVIAHGFAGSRRLMEPYAVTLARNGYLALTFDFPGHGDNPAPFVARITDQTKRVGVLVGALKTVVGAAAGQPGSDGRVALLGHSMAGDVLLRYGAAHREAVAVTVLISPYLAEDAPRTEPNNLLFVCGALEPGMIHEASREAIAAATGGPVATGVTYGSAGDGSARRLVLAEGVEHIGVLFGRGGLSAALEWLDQTFGRTGSGFIDSRGPALGLLFLGLAALTWPLSRLLPRAATAPLGAGLDRRRLLLVAVIPALLTPLLLRPLPTDYLPILLGDYLALHFGLYGLLTAAGILLATRGRGATPPGRVIWGGLIIGSLAAGAWLSLALALPADRFVTAFLPTGERLPILLGILPGTWAFFVADAWLTRGTGTPWWAPVLTKTLFLLSLLLAVVINLSELFFLIILVPAILVFFLFYGLIGGWIYQRTGHPLVGALAIGLAFAWAIAVTFPLVGA